MESIKFKKGETIFKSGDISDCMYDIKWGQVGIFADFGEKTQKQLTTLYEGDFFGEMGLIDSCPRSATAVALEPDTICRKLTIDDISDYLKENPAKIITILQHTGDRLRHLSEDYIEACRTIDEYLEAEEKKVPKSSSLIEKMKRFVKVAKNSK